MNSLKTFLNSPFFFWAVIALPSVGMIAGALNGRDLESLLHPTGEFSARFMIIAMMLTPLRMMFPGATWIRWLMARRRYLGVAAFGYAVLHTLYYVIDLGSLSAVMADVVKLGIWTGWIAFLIFVPLALTSNGASVRAMGPGWQTLQKLVYVAAIMTLLHWITIHNTFGGALAHFLPLGVLEAYRVWKNATGRKKKLSPADAS